MPFQCDGCKSTFQERKSLLRHERSKHGSVMFQCGQCGYTCTRKDNLTRHERSKHTLPSKRKIEPEPHVTRKRCHYEDTDIFISDDEMDDDEDQIENVQSDLNHAPPPPPVLPQIEYKPTHTQPTFQHPQPFRVPTQLEYNIPMHLAYPIPNPNPMHLTYPNPMQLEYNTPASIEYIQPAPIEYNQPTPIEYNQPTPIEYNQPTPIEYNQPASIEYNQPEPIEYNKPATLQYTKHTPIEYIQPPTHALVPAPAPTPAFTHALAPIRTPAPAPAPTPVPTLAPISAPTNNLQTSQSCDECNQTKLPMITRDKRCDKTKITFKCTLCDTDFARKSSLMRHNKRFHEAFHQIEKGIKRKSNFEETHNKRFKSTRGEKRKLGVYSVPSLGWIEQKHKKPRTELSVYEPYSLE